ncbi:MAG: hypothetical protein ISR69_09405, partial [Gammaproteobacteria bacterium]|nr:hypothetical protein [Gammaproteobacteria bacterium]
MPRRRKHRKIDSSTFLDDSSGLELIKLYSLRLLTRLGAHRSFIEKAYPQEITFSNDNIARLIGIDQWLDSKLEEDDGVEITTRKEVLQAIQSMHETAEAEADE